MSTATQNQQSVTLTSNQLAELATLLVHSLYTKDRQKQEDVFLTYYTPTSAFLDPLGDSRSLPLYSAQFKLLERMSADIQVSINHVAVDTANQTVIVDNMQRYKLFSSFTPVFPLRVISKLRFHDGKVIEHEDIWDFRDVISVWFIRPFYQLYRFIQPRVSLWVWNASQAIQSHFTPTSSAKTQQLGAANKPVTTKSA